MDFYGGAESSFHPAGFFQPSECRNTRKKMPGVITVVLLIYFFHVGSPEGWEPWCQNQVENPRFICCSSGAKAA